jgi:hypothetical protein
MSKPKKGEVPENFKNSKKHRCPQCEHVGVNVTDKRNHYGEETYLDYSRRRRQCQLCGYKWSTVEVHFKFYELMKKVARMSKQEPSPGQFRMTKGRSYGQLFEKLRSALSERPCDDCIGTGASEGRPCVRCMGTGVRPGTWGASFPAGSDDAGGDEPNSGDEHGARDARSRSADTDETTKHIAAICRRGGSDSKGS